MYTFAYAPNELIISGTGNMGPVNGNFPMDQFIAQSGDSIGASPTVFVLQNPSIGRVAFKADIAEIDPGLPPGFTVADILANITSSTAMPVGPFSTSIAFGDGAATDFTLTHGLNAPVVLWEVRFTAAPQEYPTFSRQRIDNNTVRVFGFLVPPTLNQFTADFVKG